MHSCRRQTVSWTAKVLCILVLCVALPASLWAKPPTSRGTVSLKNVDSASQRGRFRALLIANEDYKDLSTLQSPIKDASALKAALEKHYGFTVKLAVNVKTFDDMDALIEAFLTEGETKSDSLLVYYAGHGIRKGTRGYWAPTQAQRGKRSTFWDNSLMSDYLNDTEAKHVAIITDACFSGALLAGMRNVRARTEDYASAYKKRSFEVLTSGANEPVPDTGAKGHSPFAYYLVNGLNNNTSPAFDLSDLFPQVRAGVRRFNKEVKPIHQHIKGAVGEGGAFVFYKQGTAVTDGREVGSAPEWTAPDAGGSKKVAVDFATDPPGLGIRLDGESIGVGPLRKIMDAGRHSAVVDDRCYAAQGMEFSLQAGENKTITLRPDPQPAGLRVTAQDPKGNDLVAEVTVDGKVLGNTPNTFTVPVCSKSLVVRHGASEVTQTLALKEKSVTAFTAKLEGSDAPTGDRSPSFFEALKFDFWQGLIPRPKRTVQHYKKACKAGDKLACKYKKWHRGKDLADFPAAKGAFGPACGKGQLTACVALGWVLTQKTHEPGYPYKFHPSIERGVQAFRKACEGGNMRGCLELGRLYDYGAGVPKDNHKASDLYKAACDGGNMRGCASLGTSYRDGEGVAEDLGIQDRSQKGFQLHKKACDGGDVYGCDKLAYYHYREYTKSTALYHKTCMAGSVVGCANLGWNLIRGSGVGRDVVEGKRFLQMSCDAINEWACNKLKQL